jgi:hypothetical protein
MKDKDLLLLVGGALAITYLSKKATAATEQITKASNVGEGIVNAITPLTSPITKAVETITTTPTPFIQGLMASISPLTSLQKLIPTTTPAISFKIPESTILQGAKGAIAYTTESGSWVIPPAFSTFLGIDAILGTDPVKKVTETVKNAAESLKNATTTTNKAIAPSPTTTEIVKEIEKKAAENIALAASGVKMTEPQLGTKEVYVAVPVGQPQQLVPAATVAAAISKPVVTKTISQQITRSSTSSAAKATATIKAQRASNKAAAKSVAARALAQMSKK